MCVNTHTPQTTVNYIRSGAYQHYAARKGVQGMANGFSMLPGEHRPSSCDNNEQHTKYSSVTEYVNTSHEHVTQLDGYYASLSPIVIIVST